MVADLGPAVTTSVVAQLRSRLASKDVRTEADARAVLREVLIAELQPDLDRSVRALPHDDHPSVLLVVGVNGTGKTTTVGKLARVLVADGRRVVLGAADTFRAAAADQLQTWAARVGAEVVRGAEGADPASVAFDAVDKGIAAGADVVRDRHRRPAAHQNRADGRARQGQAGGDAGARRSTRCCWCSTPPSGRTGWRRRGCSPRSSTSPERC